MTARRERRTAARTRKAARAAWRRNGKPRKLSASKITIRIQPEREADNACHYRAMLGQFLRGEVPTFGRPRDREYEQEEAERFARLALAQWRALGALAVAGCLDAQAAIAAIAHGAGLVNPLVEIELAQAQAA